MMTPATVTKRSLSTAEERREAVLTAAMQVFGERGFLGTPTMDIAQAAGISQAYLFRLFPSKLDLVLAVVERSNQAIYDAFAKAAAQLGYTQPAISQQIHRLEAELSETLFVRDRRGQGAGDPARRRQADRRADRLTREPRARRATAAPRSVAARQAGSSSISLPWFSPVNSLSSAWGNSARPCTMSSRERSLPAATHCAISAIAAG